MTPHVIVLFVAVLAIAYVFFNYVRIKKMPEGTAEMVEMSGIIRDGANAFLKTEFKSIAIVCVVIAIVLSLFVEATSGLTFLVCTEEEYVLAEVTRQRNCCQFALYAYVMTDECCWIFSVSIKEAILLLFVNREH